VPKGQSGSAANLSGKRTENIQNSRSNGLHLVFSLATEYFRGHFYL